MLAQLKIRCNGICDFKNGADSLSEPVGAKHAEEQMILKRWVLLRMLRPYTPPEEEQMILKR
jgi:hypothetical protein